MEWIADPVDSTPERYGLTAVRCNATTWNAGRHGFAAEVGYGGMTTAHYSFSTLEDAQAWCLTELAELRASGRCEPKFAHAVIDELREEYRDEIERLRRENQQMAGQLGFTQAKLQEAEKTIALLMAPKDEPEQPAAPEPKRSWWKRLLG